MKAITTKYLGPTNYKGSRIKATEPDGQSVTLSWSHETDAEGNAWRAARALCEKMEARSLERMKSQGIIRTKITWDADLLICGRLKDGYVFVFTS